MNRDRLFSQSKAALLMALCAVLVVTGVGAVSAQGNYSVAILVVDDFGSVDLATLDPGQFDAADSCTISLEGQAYAVRGVSATPLAQSHGDLVYQELELLLGDIGANNFIVLIPVEIQGVSTEVAAQRIATAIEDHPADFYVINMSFAIIPCEYLQAFAEYDAQLMDSRKAKNENRYRNLFQRAVIFYNDTVFPAMSRRAQNLQNLDPLQTLFASLGNRAIPVAAAGNFGLDFPFWPGAWSQVVSVSASKGQGFHASPAWDKKSDAPLLDAEVERPGKKKRISNYGEVMMPGEYSSPSGPLSGTSFAAPRLSVALAVYLSAVGPNNCRNTNGGPALAYGDWDNLTLQQAAQQYCPDLLPYLP